VGHQELSLGGTTVCKVAGSTHVQLCIASCNKLSKTCPLHRGQVHGLGFAYQSTAIVQISTLPFRKRILCTSTDQAPTRPGGRHHASENRALQLTVYQPSCQTKAKATPAQGHSLVFQVGLSQSVLKLSRSRHNICRPGHQSADRAAGQPYTQNHTQGVPLVAAKHLVEGAHGEGCSNCLACIGLRYCAHSVSLQG
jgi:hypothetical protein